MAEPKSEIKEISASKRELDLEVDAEEALKEYEAALEQYTVRVKVKGFRQGKAPRNVVKGMYEAEIREAMFDSIAPRAVGRELAAHQASPVNTPVITDLSWEEGGALKLKAEFEVWPEFKLPEYKKIGVKKKQDAVTAKDVDKSLDDLRERSAQYIPVEGRGIRQDDYVLLRIQGRDVKTGRLLPAEKIFVLAGHQDNEKALNENVLGMQASEEKNFQVDYPQDHPNKKVAGKTIDYHLTVLSIKEKSLSEVDDGFAKDLGKFENLKELKSEIRKQLEESREQSRKREISEEVVQKVTDSVDPELPESLVQQETLVQLRRIIQSAGQTPTKEGDRALWEEQAEFKARQVVKNHLVLMRIAEAENLGVSEEEITEEFQSLAQANNVPLAQVVDAMNRENRKAEVKQNLLLRKTIDFLVDNATIE